MGLSKRAPTETPVAQVKKAKVDGDDGTLSLGGGVHPYGIKPWGNALIDTQEGVEHCRPGGLGLLNTLPDEALVAIFEHLHPRDLGRLAVVSRAFYVFCCHEELWRTAVLQEYEGDFWFDYCWRFTYRRMVTGKAAEAPPKPIAVSGFYSDILFQSWLCTSVANEAAWIRSDNIERRSGKTMSPEQFRTEYVEGNRPVIITDVVESWPAKEKWTEERLVARFGECKFSAGGFDMTMEKYFHYASQVNDDQPLYLFDKNFSERAPGLVDDYTVPQYFQEDLFKVMGNNRPDYRWIIIGPKNSGSSFHKDPNATSAFNACVKGKKKWILLPPHVLPPGVHPSESGGEVATPISITEWFITFYSQLADLAVEPIEGIHNEGEIMYIPSGWWHLVINLEPSIAVTHNFVESVNLAKALGFVVDKPDQISGYCGDTEKFGELFMEALREKYPKELENALTLKAEMDKPKSLWAEITSKHNGNSDEGNDEGFKLIF